MAFILALRRALCPDALMIANCEGRAAMALVAVGAFALTRLFQRVVPGT